MLPSLSNPRPLRFPIRAPFRYRESGSPFWHSGITIDISRSGVLFGSEQRLSPWTLLEMHIDFPPEMTGGTPSAVLGCGPVVRAELPALPALPFRIAVLFLNYRFESR